MTHLANDGIKWKIIPPRAPNFGGMWESGVKLIKNRLKGLLENTHLTYELFCIILIKYDGILNSRHSVPLYFDPNDFSALAPSHFLIRRLLISVPASIVTEINKNRIARFQYSQKIQQQFWARWKKEYFLALHVPVEWNKFHSNLQKGNLVFVKDDKALPFFWKLGRMQNVYPGDDGHVRVASIRTRNGIIKRAIDQDLPASFFN